MGWRLSSLGAPPRVAAFGVALWAAACAAERVPPPETAARQWAEALESGDPARVHPWLSSRAREELSDEEIAALLEGEKEELGQLGRELKAQELSSRARARLLLEDGTEVTLELEEGRFLLRGAGVVPAAPQSPLAALAELRVALERKSLPSLLLLLSEEERRKFEDLFESLVSALAEGEFGRVRVTGERAEVELPSGVRVLLRREGGAWRVEEIE